MKRLSFMLAAILLISALLTSCAGDSGTPSEAASSTEALSEDVSASSEASEEPSEESVQIEVVETEYTKLIDSILVPVDKTLPRENLLKGRKYVSLRESDPAYKDNGKLLTDGIVPTAFDGSSYAGYGNSRLEQMRLDFDLGKVMDGIAEFHVYLYNQTDYGIGLPDNVGMSISDDGENYVKVGSAYASRNINPTGTYDFSVLLQGSVSARYIRFDFDLCDNAWMFIGEVEVIAYGENYKSNEEKAYYKSEEYYGVKEVPVITEEVLWDADSSDYDTVVNLVKGKKPMVFFRDMIQSELATDWYNTVNISLLTNGKRSSNQSYTSSEWFHNTRGGSRSFVFDLGAISSVSSVSAGFLKDSAPSINLPTDVRVLVSLDGVEWHTAYAPENPSAAASVAIYRLEGDFDKEYQARYVKLQFTISTHVYMDEIEIYGKKNAKDAEKPVADEEEIKTSTYITPDDFDGVHNMLLSYHCLKEGSTHTEGGLITADEYLPYVAYLDKDGKVADTLFDAYLYLPYTRFNYDDSTRTFDGWKFYVDDIYYPERNMNALNTCVGNVKKELGLDDYKVMTYTSILYTFRNKSDGSTKNVFGDVDGDGKSEDFSKLEDRKKAIKWLMDEEYNRFKEGNYENLGFGGFYWFEESIDYGDPHEADLIRFASDHAHELGVKLFWIPYYTASGYADWKALGFDLACMQPNYMFTAAATKDVLYENARKTKDLGMCVEMEITNPENKEDAKRFTEYMLAGAETGYMNGVKIYYQNGVPGGFSIAAYSKTKNVRKVYDNLYLYAKEKLTPEDIRGVIEGTEDVTINCKADKSIRFKVSVPDSFGDYAGEMVLAMSPKYGGLRFDGGDAIVYYAPKGYKGTDTFIFYYDVGFEKSGEIVVTVNIQ